MYHLQRTYLLDLIVLPTLTQRAANNRPIRRGPLPSRQIPFDPASLRLGPELVAASGVKKHLVTIPVKKPSKEWFVRTHEDPNYRLETCVIELKEDNETYLVSRDLGGSS